MLLFNNDHHAHWLVPARIRATELIDLPGVTNAELAANLADMARVNRWVGGAWLTLRALERLVGNVPAGAALTLLDVATGGADIPQALSSWAKRRGVHAHVIATDISPQIVQIANHENKEQREKNVITFATADGTALPFSSGSVDVALCSFALHHLEPAQAITMLREMGRVARRGVIVNDLVRWRPAYWATWMGTRLLSRNRLTIHDGPLSVLRAYTLDEMHDLVAQAGLRVLANDHALGYRVALTLANRREDDKMTR
jgi:2-polyprenyl-3-methyl-5-hydroxy-6-metoxy-1,4-benzoquinol methylase